MNDLAVEDHANLAVIDAETPGRMHGLVIRAALHAMQNLGSLNAEGRTFTRNRALGYIRHAQAIRRA